MGEKGFGSYEELHRWSVDRREEFWGLTIGRLGIRFRVPPERILAPGSDVTRPDWLPGAQLNIVESCFKSSPEKTALIYGREGDPAVQRLSYRELERWTNRVANGLDDMGLGSRDRVGMYLPLTPESVAIYLGIIKSGRAAVGITDSAAPQELKRRIDISETKLLFTMDSYVRDGKTLAPYSSVVKAAGPRSVVIPPPGEEKPDGPLRSGDRTWGEFLARSEDFEAVPRQPSDHVGILFSSGTTQEPKAIPWSHTTPIKSAADAYFHHDTRPEDVLAWPTSFGWMMAPWLCYAALINNAALSVFLGSPLGRPFGEFVEKAGVTMLGVAPKIVQSWRAQKTMEGLDWGEIRRYSSTAEPSDPQDMAYLMGLAGGRPVIEYCGGTEIGGGYVAGTLVQPCFPSMFTTSALGIDFLLLDENGRPSERGEVALIPPSIGLSNEGLNFDHQTTYFADFPRGPQGERLRRHGDQLERLPNGYYLHRGRVDDVLNLHGVKASSEAVRQAILHSGIIDAKPVGIDVEGSGQHALVIFAVPEGVPAKDGEEYRTKLRRDFELAIRTHLDPLLAHVTEVVLVPELPQAGPGKTLSSKGFRKIYAAWNSWKKDAGARGSMEDFRHFYDRWRATTP